MLEETTRQRAEDFSHPFRRPNDGLDSLPESGGGVSDEGRSSSLPIMRPIIRCERYPRGPGIRPPELREPPRLPLAPRSHLLGYGDAEHAESEKAPIPHIGWQRGVPSPCKKARGWDRATHDFDPAEGHSSGTMLLQSRRRQSWPQARRPLPPAIEASDEMVHARQSNNQKRVSFDLGSK